MNDDIKRVRNLNYEPYLNSEGKFWKSLPAPPEWQKDQHWFERLPPNHRLFYHQTLNSARNSVSFQPFDFYPKDSLDFMLGAVYNQTQDIFNEKTEVAFQHETIKQKQRRLRNTRDLSPKRKIAIGHPLAIGWCFFLFRLALVNVYDEYLLQVVLRREMIQTI